MRRIATTKPHYERVPLEPKSSFYLMHSRSSGYPLYLHYHPEIELTLIVKGRGVRFVGDSVQPFQEGDLCLLGSNILHSWYTGDEPMACEAVVIQFRPDLLTRMAEHWPELKRLPQLPSLCARGLAIAGHSSQTMTDQILQMPQTPADSAARFALFLQVMEGFCAATDAQTLSTSPAIPQADPAMSRFQHVIDALHAQMPLPPDQAAMAREANMTPAAFSRFFKRLVGRGYVDYVNAWRVGLACRQLIQTDLPITQIAFDCGFENLSNFNRRFRQYKNMTPRQYRQLAST